VQRLNIDDDGMFRTEELVIEDALAEHKHLLVIITLGARATSVYFDGVLVGGSDLLGRTIGNFTGRLVLGSSPTSSDSWSGQISGLAIYGRELMPARVFEHYEAWITDRRPTFTQDDRAGALYLFGERKGKIVHNLLASAKDLVIPVRYLVLRPAFLSLPWRNFHFTWSYWEDISINIAGFIPFGFFWIAYLSTARATRNAVVTAIFLGFLTSLLIEVLQAYLPTRHSGMVTNTCGTNVGALLYLSPFLQSIMSKAAFCGIGSRSGDRPSIELRIQA
jgi:hypothetical protein